MKLLIIVINMVWILNVEWSCIIVIMINCFYSCDLLQLFDTRVDSILLHDRVCSKLRVRSRFFKRYAWVHYNI